MVRTADESSYRIVDVNEANIDEHGLFCLKSKKKTEGYRRKFEWAKERFKEGLQIKLLLVNEGPRRGFRSRGFIEYIPGEFTWRGIDAKGYMVIHCIWVVGRNRGHGYGSKLLELCLNDAKEMQGVAAVTSSRTWLPGAKLFIKHGFEKVDSMMPDLELYVKRFSNSVPMPKFYRFPEEKLKEYARGITVFQSDQCPYVFASVKTITETAKQAGIPVRIKAVKSCEEAQNSVHPYGTFSVLFDGKLLTYHSISGKGLLDCLSQSKSTRERRGKMKLAEFDMVDFG